MKGSHRAGQSRSSQKSRKSGKRDHESQGGGDFKQKKAGIPTQRGSRAVKGQLGHVSLEMFEGRLGVLGGGDGRSLEGWA